MGNYLPSPNSDKIVESFSVGTMQYACCEMQGWRCAMEDAHLFRYFEHLDCTDGPALVCGVYDGHGGRHVASFVARHLIDELFRDGDFRKGRFEVAFRSTYISLDRLLGISQSELLWHSRRALKSSPRTTATTAEVAAENETAPPTSDESFAPLTALLWEQTTVISREAALRIINDLEQAENPDRRAVPRRHHHTSTRRKKSGQGGQYPEALPPTPLATDHPTAEAESINYADGSSRLSRWRRSAAVRAAAAANKRESPIGDLTPRGLQATSSNGLLLPPPPQQQAEDPQGNSGFRSFISNLFKRSATQPQLPSEPLPLNHLAMHAGCTAVTVLVSNKKIVVANAGDSRCVLCRGDTAFDLSKDHKPQNSSEKARIYAAGGWVEMGRVNGNLNLSRAIGDLHFKSGRALPPEKQVVSCVPDVTITELLPLDEFLIIGCDGIWEASSSQEIVDFVKLRLDNGLKLSAILEELLDELLSPNPTLFEFGCDNMTAMIVDLRAQQRLPQSNPTPVPVTSQLTQPQESAGDAEASAATVTPPATIMRRNLGNNPNFRRLHGRGRFRSCLPPRTRSGTHKEGRFLFYEDNNTGSSNNSEPRRPMSDGNLGRALGGYADDKSDDGSPVISTAAPSPEAQLFYTL